jgi:uncharacterized protein (TIGR02646 family)
MRLITKGKSGGYHLDQAHQNPPHTTTEATSRWKSFGYKDKVQEYLLDEQYGLCCYSELRADRDALGYHIEHVYLKSQYPTRTFDYTNLAASALDSEDIKIIKEEAFGGHASGKKKDFNLSLFISCHELDCDRYFAYLSDGRVVPSNSLSDLEKSRADYTITLLNLNSPYLVNRRRRWYNELDELFEEHFVKDWNIEHLAAIDLLPTNQKLSQFFSVTRQFFGAVAERILLQA